MRPSISTASLTLVTYLSTMVSHAWSGPFPSIFQTRPCHHMKGFTTMVFPTIDTYMSLGSRWLPRGMGGLVVVFCTPLVIVIDFLNLGGNIAKLFCFINASCDLKSPYFNPIAISIAWHSISGWQLNTLALRPSFSLQIDLPAHSLSRYFPNRCLKIKSKSND